MKKLNLWQCSCPADEACVVYCQSHANLILHNINPDCEAELVKVKSQSGTVHFVWVGKNGEEICFCPVFAGETEDIPAIEDVEQMNENEVFCHNGGVYYVHINKRNKVVIRMLTVLMSQNVVEQVVHYNFEKCCVKSICLIHLFAIGKGKQYLAPVWSVYYDDGLIEYMPVFDKDEEIFARYNIGALLKEEAKTGSCFRYRNKLYYVQEDENGKLYLSVSGNVAFHINGKKVKLPDKPL